jgi:hypothetical protein
MRRGDHGHRNEMGGHCRGVVGTGRGGGPGGAGDSGTVALIHGYLVVLAPPEHRLPGIDFGPICLE